MIYPRFLQNGDTVAVTACSDGKTSEPDIARLENGMRQFVRRGYRCIETADVRHSEKGRSASAAVRAKELNELLENDAVAAIIQACGGDYLPEMLPYLDYSRFMKSPKWLQGYSDPTGLLFTVTTMCDIATVYSGNFADFGMEIWHSGIEDNLKILEGNIVKQESFDKYMDGFLEKKTGLEGYLLTEDVEWKNLNGEEELVIEGRLLGGCLDVLINLCGTRFDMVKEFIEKYSSDGILWYLESFDLNSELLFLALWNLREAGWFKYVKGFVFGRPCMYSSNYDIVYAEVLHSALDEVGVPVIYDADFGHKPPRMTLINGALAKVCCKDSKGSLEMRLA